LSPLCDVATNAGKTVKLECDVSLGKPKAEIRWYRDAREIYKGVKHRLACDDNVASLTITGVDHTDAGNYRCEVYNQHGRVESTGNLVVNVAPVIDVDARYRAPQEVKSGSTLILPVNFSATPRPKVSWFRNGTPLGPRPGHVLIDSGDTYSTLTVLGVEGEEGGRYEAKVENIAGSARQAFDVVIKSVPLPPSSLRVTSIQRDAVTLSWEEPDDDGGVPITGYVIERSDATRGGWATIGTVDAMLTNSFRVPKLLEGGA
jgi:titin